MGLLNCELHKVGVYIRWKVTLELENWLPMLLASISSPLQPDVLREGQKSRDTFQEGRKWSCTIRFILTCSLSLFLTYSLIYYSLNEDVAGQLVAGAKSWDTTKQPARNLYKKMKLGGRGI